ncbi:hypothetical protein YTPLAS18_23000 [Nitrospira sp.]|nr:hypothetical protein YTPLAS18_23000 [Nitrospira sp.]
MSTRTDKWRDTGREDIAHDIRPWRPEAVRLGKVGEADWTYVGFRVQTRSGSPA